jgi:two-component system response regulator FixJ
MQKFICEDSAECPSEKSFSDQTLEIKRARMSDKCHTVCVVDDDPSVCKALSRVIRLAGFDVRSYSSSQELLDADQFGGIDLLLLDIRMPVMDGFALQDYLSTNGFSVPIVFMTAHDVDKARSKAMEKGAVAFLEKPFVEKDLLEAINKGLTRINRK